MSIYTTSLSQIDTASLTELLQEGAVENLRLEFKREIPGKDETLKKLSSFANTFGGFVVIGAAAQSKDGKIQDLPGVEQTPGYKQKIVDWCFKECSPPISVDVSGPIPTPSNNGRVCYVISVEESEVAPHFVNGRNGVWIRTNEFSGKYNFALADEDELRQLLHRRELTLGRRRDIVERARKRFTYYLSTTSEKPAHAGSPGALLELCLVPRFPSKHLCKQEDLPKLVKDVRYPSYRGVGFPRLQLGVMTQHESAIIREPLTDLSFFEINVWGMLFYVTKLDEKAYTDKVSGIHVYAFVGHLLMFLQHANDLLQLMGATGSMLVETSLKDIRDRQWLYAQTIGSGIAPVGSSKPISGLDDAFALSVSTTVEILRERPDDILMELLRSIFFSLNWADLTDTEGKLQSLIQDGRRFNCG
jgi:Putative DNA-binding domain